METSNSNQLKNFETVDLPNKEETISKQESVKHDLIMDNAVINKNTIQLKVLVVNLTIN